MLKGIDVSRWQTTTPSLAGLSFIGIQCAYGAASADPMYSTHLAAAKKAGLFVIAYLFGRNESGAAQAATLLDLGANADLLALDFEDDAGHLHMTVAQAKEVITTVHAAGRKIALYASDDMFTNQAYEYLKFGQDYNWIAKWGTAGPSHPYTFWQYRGSPLDLDYYTGTLASLKALGDMNAMGILSVSLQAEDWTPTPRTDQYKTNGVFRATPDRNAPIINRQTDLTPVRSVAKVVTSAAVPDNDWRSTIRNSQTLYMLRGDWMPVTPGGDPVVQQQYVDFVNRVPCPPNVKHSVVLSVDGSPVFTQTV